MEFAIEFELEKDGRWIAEISALPGVMAYGVSRREAESQVEAMALRVIAERMERESSTRRMCSWRRHEPMAQQQGGVS